MLEDLRAEREKERDELAKFYRDIHMQGAYRYVMMGESREDDYTILDEERTIRKPQGQSPAAGPPETERQKAAVKMDPDRFFENKDNSDLFLTVQVEKGLVEGGVPEEERKTIPEMLSRTAYGEGAAAEQRCQVCLTPCGFCHKDAARCVVCRQQCRICRGAVPEGADHPGGAVVGRAAELMAAPLVGATLGGGRSCCPRPDL